MFDRVRKLKKGDQIGAGPEEEEAVSVSAIREKKKKKREISLVHQKEEEEEVSTEKGRRKNMMQCCGCALVSLLPLLLPFLLLLLVLVRPAFLWCGDGRFCDFLFDCSNTDKYSLQTEGTTFCPKPFDANVGWSLIAKASPVYIPYAII